MSLSENLDDSYGRNDMEKLSSVIFETKEHLPETTYMLISELLLKVDKMIDHPLLEPHYLFYEIVTPLINATDQIKKELDYVGDNYNSDYEELHDYDDEDNVQYVKTKSHCKIYLKEKLTAILLVNDIVDIFEYLKDSQKSEKSFCNFYHSLNVATNKHVKKVASALKDNIDTEWVKCDDTLIAPYMIKPTVFP
tara:strand:+ start:947 stop:1528 length:582 start_codon:yes stop_codon:yes gene_type:complete